MTGGPNFTSNEASPISSHENHSTPIRNGQSRVYAVPASGQCLVICESRHGRARHEHHRVMVFDTVPITRFHALTRNRAEASATIKMVYCQSSSSKPGTRLNSEVLCDTNVSRFAKAMAAMITTADPFAQTRPGAGVRSRLATIRPSIQPKPAIHAVPSNACR